MTEGRKVSGYEQHEDDFWTIGGPRMSNPTRQSSATESLSVPLPRKDPHKTSITLKTHLLYIGETTTRRACGFRQSSNERQGVGSLCWTSVFFFWKNVKASVRPSENKNVRIDRVIVRFDRKMLRCYSSTALAGRELESRRVEKRSAPN